MSEAESPFSLLLLRQRSNQQRERLHQLRDKFRLEDDDAVWGFLAVVEAYCDDLTARLAPSPPKAATLPRSLIWATLSCALAAQVIVLALAYHLGQQSPAASAAGFLQVPAGWMAFVLALPALVLIASIGWRTRRADRWVGWGLMTLAVIALAACLVALLSFG